MTDPSSLRDAQGRPEQRRGARASGSPRASSRGECPREAEVLEAVAFDRISQLQDHIAACAICGEIADIAGLLHADHKAACREAQVPPPGIVWWRATIRARAEAARTVSQPITLLQGIAGACTVGLAFGLITAAWPSLPSADGVGGLLARLASNEEMVSTSALVLRHGLPLVLGLAACLVIAPLALYVALSDD